MTVSSWPEIVFAGEADTGVLTRAVQRGTLRRLARGTYTSDMASSADAIVKRHIWRITGHEFPGAVIADRSVRAGGMVEHGALYVVHKRRRPLELPGVTISPRQGSGPVRGDIPLPDDLWLSSTERGLLDNLAGTADRLLPRTELEEWIDRLLTQRGEDGVNALRDNASEIAGPLGRQPQLRELDALVGASLATRTNVELASPVLRARATGSPYDKDRLEMFSALAERLRDTPPDVVPALPADVSRRRLLPFYEAYFSNFIEGTEFTPDEAAEIVFDRKVPEARPEDAHDIIGTYEIVADSVEMATVPRSGDGLAELLRARHAVLMGRRPDKHPGAFKSRANRAGLTEFVVPELVTGTIQHGVEAAKDLTSPFSRAVYIMFLITEVHPFDDGNGRVARIMMNAELVAGGEVRIIIPTVYRANYLSALKGASHNRSFGALISVLSYARRYTARVDFSTRQAAEDDLARTNAFRDALDAEASGVRLILP